nr:hypothetical protein [Tanacetum cinerariifolium]
MSIIWIGSYHVFVSIAKFKRTSNTEKIQIPNVNVSRAPLINGIKNHSLFSGRQPVASIAIGDVDSKKHSDNETQCEGNLIQLCDSDLIKVEDTSTVILAKVKEVDSISNMYAICSNEGFLNITIHYIGGLWVWIQFENTKSCEAFKANESLKTFWSSLRNVSLSFTVDEILIWIDIIGLPLCAWGSNAIKKKKNDTSFESDASDCQSSGIEKFIKEDISPIQVPTKEETTFIPKNEEVNASEPLFPPCFEKACTGIKNGSKSSSSYKCSTSFGSYKFKDKKGFSFIDEMNRMIEVGDALGYDVKGCKRSMRKMINGIAWLGEDHEVLLLCGIQVFSQRIGFGVTITTSLWKEVGLIDLPMGGRMFTWMNKSESKLSKLDRFMVSNNVLIAHSYMNVTASDADRLLRINTLQELDNLEKLDSMDLIQKARVKWDVEGDENSKKIHGVINSKRKSQAIQGILHEGIWITDPSDIKLAFLNFYKEKFSCQVSSVIFPSMSNMKHLTNLDRANLDSMVTLDEIKSVVWDCGSQKALGPDGISFKFVKHFWEVMKPDIQNFVLHFFFSGSFPPGLNSFFSLLSQRCLILFILKTLDLFRLSVSNTRLWQKSLQTDSQRSSIRSLIMSKPLLFRVAKYSILILSEVIDWYKKRKKKLLLFKVGFEKAFDSVSWRFLDHVLDKMGFSGTWRNWIMAGLRSSRASILVNGSPTSEFSFKRGLRQGDPFSPFLFIIVMEGLHYALMDGLRANLFRGSNMSKFSNWNVLIERFKSRLSGWKANMLSSGGRLTLIKSVLSSLGIYYFSIFKAPEAVLKVLESLRAAFFWGATGDKRKIAWIKCEAGIDLKGCQTNGLWARIVGTIFHLHSSDFVPLNSLRFKVGDGYMVRFWKDAWLGDTPLCHRFNRLYRLEKNPNCYIIDRIVKCSWKWDWNRSIFGGRLQADLHKLLVDIGSLNIEVDSDCLVSSLSTDGFFSVSFTRKHIDNCMLSSSLPSTRWCKIIPQKVNIFMWRMFLDRLPHRLNLSSRGLDLDSILCSVCNEVIESNSHLFFSCVAASNIWRLIRGWCDLKTPMLSSCDDWVSWFSSWTASRVEKDRAYVIFASTCWMI